MRPGPNRVGPAALRPSRSDARRRGVREGQGCSLPTRSRVTPTPLRWVPARGGLDSEGRGSSEPRSKGRGCSAWAGPEAGGAGGARRSGPGGGGAWPSSASWRRDPGRNCRRTVGRVRLACRNGRGNPVRTSGPGERWSRRSAPGTLPGGPVDGGFGLRAEKGLEGEGEFSPVGVRPIGGGSCTAYGRLP